MTDPMIWLAIAGLVVISVVTRSFFFLAETAWPFPRWLEIGLRYAPVGALCAVAVPAVTGSDLSAGHVAAWSPRVVAMAVALLVTWWKKEMLLTIATGMAAYHCTIWIIRSLL